MIAPAHKQKIAILGGGISSLVTAFELTAREDWQCRYDVTVYQMGWRLGGKGASSRSADDAQRIEEHGLHVFFGFYDNAFWIMKRCYDELGRPEQSPLASFEQAWRPRDNIVMQEFHNGRFRHWPVTFERNACPKGVPPTNDVPSTWSYVRKALQWACKALCSLELHRPHAPGTDGPVRPHTAPLRLLAQITRPLRQPELPALQAVLEAAQRHEPEPGDGCDAVRDSMIWALKRVQNWLSILHDEEATLDFESHKLLVSASMGVTIALGLLRDGLFWTPTNWHSIDDLDFRAWLRRHGACSRVLDSALVRALYAAGFGTGLQAAAGTTLHGCLRAMFTYREAFVHEMQAGMGEVVFAPLYEVLKRRGVRFEFFQRVENLVVDRGADDQPYIAAVEIDVQATLKSGEYQPLIEVDGLPCWPSEPDYDQLQQDKPQEQFPGERSMENWWARCACRSGGSCTCKVATRRLLRGQDFDHCVLGISIGAFPHICAQLIAENKRFRSMVQNVKTTLTQAAQLWLEPTLQELGWQQQRFDPDNRPIVIPYAEGFDTWADMSHLIARERWPVGKVGSIAYLCARLPEGPDYKLPDRHEWRYPFGQLQRARRNLREWLCVRPAQLWPSAVCEDGEDDRLFWDHLVAPEGVKGIDRLAAQWCVADWNPSDRYVLATAGATAYRLRPDESGFANLTLTGDWTRNSFNAGCVEAAVAAGMRASRAISGFPEVIAGNWLDLVEAAPPRRTQLAEPMPAPPRRSQLRESVRAWLFGRARCPSAPQPPRRWPPAPDGRVAVPQRPRAGELLTTPPLLARNVTMYSFRFEADRAALQSLCDRYLNLGASEHDDRYEPANAEVVFAAVQIERAFRPDVNAHDRIEPFAWMAERDYAFWVPINVYGAGASCPKRRVWFHPFMWIDNDLAVLDGREIYGLDKAPAELDGPMSRRRPQFEVRAVMPNSWRIEPRLRLGREGAFVDARARRLNLAEAIGPLRYTLKKLMQPHSWEDTLCFWLQLLTGTQISVGLKQFPALDNTDSTSYQSLVETPSHALRPPCLRWVFGTYHLDFRDHGPERILETLGLHGTRVDGGWSRVTAVAQVRADFDFTMGDGREVRANCSHRYVPNPARLPQLLYKPVHFEPLRSQDTVTHAFALRADHSTLTRLCDDLLNLGPEVYTPAGELCFFVVEQCDNTVRTIMGGREARRRMPERRAAFWMPLIGCAAPGDQAPRLVWHCSYCWCDNRESVLDERELFGMGTSWAEIDLSEQHASAAAASFRVQAVATDLRGGEAKPEELVRVFGGRYAPLCEELAPPAPDAHGLAWLLRQVLSEQPALGRLPCDPTQVPLCLVALRQYPAVEDVNGVCYQAIIETRLAVAGSRDAQLGSGFRLDVRSFPSHKIVEKLGLQCEPAPRGKRAAVVAALRFTSTITRLHPRETYRIG